MLPQKEGGAEGEAAGVKDNARAAPVCWAGKAFFAGLRKSSGVPWSGQREDAWDLTFIWGAWHLVETQAQSCACSAGSDCRHFRWP